MADKFLPPAAGLDFTPPTEPADKPLVFFVIFAMTLFGVLCGAFYAGLALLAAKVFQ